MDKKTPVFENSNIEQMIDVIVNGTNVDDKEDLKQELYKKVVKLTTGCNNNHINNLEKYIFICLKNKAKTYAIKDHERKNKILSFNENISLNFYEENNINFLETLDLFEEEKSLLYEHFYEGYTQKEMAIKRNTTQQNISFRINKILKKIRKMF